MFAVLLVKTQEFDLEDYDAVVEPLKIPCFVYDIRKTNAVRLYETRMAAEELVDFMKFNFPESEYKVVEIDPAKLLSST